MSQRDSGYPRQVGDFYETPAWVTMALQPHMRSVHKIWDPAAGKLSMSNVMATWPGVDVLATDIAGGTDFLAVKDTIRPVDAIITNPPYQMAQAFIEHSLELLELRRGRIAMLLRTDYDHAKTRRHLFGGCPQFTRKLVLTSRIRWFADSTGSPSFNHAWFIWDWHNAEPPTIAYHYAGETTDTIEEGEMLPVPDYGGDLSQRLRALR